MKITGAGEPDQPVAQVFSLQKNEEQEDDDDSGQRQWAQERFDKILYHLIGAGGVSRISTGIGFCCSAPRAGQTRRTSGPAAAGRGFGSLAGRC